MILLAEALDGAAFGADIALEQDGEKEQAVVADINKLNNDKDIKPLFMREKTVKGENGQPDAGTWVAAPSARISRVNLTNDAVRQALFNKIRVATDLGSDQGSVVEWSDAGLEFKNDQLELDSVHNSFDGNSVIADVSSSADVGSDPAGSYVLTGDGSLYHKAVGGERPLKSVSVEGQQMKVQGTVKSSAHYCW